MGERVKCWCGEEGEEEDMFADELEHGCGGTGTVHCWCGGDMCVCHHHGEAPCFGCPDCEGCR